MSHSKRRKGLHLIHALLVTPLSSPSSKHLEASLQTSNGCDALKGCLSNWRNKLFCRSKPLPQQPKPQKQNEAGSYVLNKSIKEFNDDKNVLQDVKTATNINEGRNPVILIHKPNNSVPVLETAAPNEPMKDDSTLENINTILEPPPDSSNQLATEKNNSGIGEESGRLVNGSFSDLAEGRFSDINQRNQANVNPADITVLDVTKFAAEVPPDTAGEVAEGDHCVYCRSLIDHKMLRLPCNHIVHELCATNGRAREVIAQARQLERIILKGCDSNEQMTNKYVIPPTLKNSNFPTFDYRKYAEYLGCPISEFGSCPTCHKRYSTKDCLYKQKNVSVIKRLKHRANSSLKSAFQKKANS